MAIQGLAVTHVARALCPRCTGLGVVDRPVSERDFGVQPCDLCDQRGTLDAEELAAWRAARIAGLAL